ncbi:hypothetical protein B0T19DRAFT_409855 [Cercophora scortea]|uniref:t-SNARE coiled-coil homology domain-containing protein n=1 Tax=Cercophora scortea TaxID=314031 RepID=A0AAE0J459_9PEZI|nr:hypothetical protein B0T19DRAFT_409855 [Cercophora scortea]
MTTLVLSIPKPNLHTTRSTKTPAKMATNSPQESIYLDDFIQTPETIQSHWGDADGIVKDNGTSSGGSKMARRGCFYLPWMHNLSSKMKKFFSKKSEEEDRGSMFGRKKSASPAPQDSNPYAQQPASDPYANSTGPSVLPPSRTGLPSGPRAGGLPRGPAPRLAYGAPPASDSNGYGAPPPAYSGSPDPSSGYGNNTFGAPGGYGGNRYNDSAPSTGSKSSLASKGSQVAPRRPGGYGGLAGPDDDSPASASSSYPSPSVKQQSTWNSTTTAPPQYTPGDTHDGYGAPRELTAEEKEDAEAQDNKNQVNEELDGTVNTLLRTTQRATDARAMMYNTLGQLASQSDRLTNSEKNLDMAEVHNRVAKEKTKDLKRLNGSMLRPAGLSSSKQAERQQEMLAAEQREKETRESVRAEAYRNNMYVQESMQSLEKPKRLGRKADAGNLSKYTFEDDDGTQAAKNAQIDDLQDNLADIAKDLHLGAMTIGTMVEKQNLQLDRMAGKADRVDDQVRRNRANLDRIH